MKIAYVSYEVSPFAKAGGLADVAGALPKYIKNAGEDIYVVMPFHKNIENNFNTSKFQLVKTGLIPDSHTCLLYTSPSPRDRQKSRMPSSA